MRIGPTAEQPRPDTPKPMTMKQLKFVLLTLVFPLLLSCSNDTLDSPEGAGGTSKKNVTHINGTDIAPETTLCGLIYDVESGAGIPGVVVSDGFDCTTTDANGVYQLVRDSRAALIFYSTPADYAIYRSVIAEAELPYFYRKIDLSVKVFRQDFKLTRLPNGKETKFRLFCMADPQCRNEKSLARFQDETIPDLKKTADEYRDAGSPVYGITLGDITDNNSTAIWEAMKKAMASIAGSVPFFQTIGNHDHLNEADNSVTSTYWKSVENFQKYFGPQNYSFDRGDVHIVSMDNVLHGEIPDLGEDQEFAAGFYDWQFEWLKRDLSYVPKDKMVILCCHVPFRGGASYCHSDKRYRREVLELLSEYAEAHLMIGHTHYNQNYIHSVNGKTIYEHIQGAACGAFWHASFNGDGTPNGYAVYDIEGAHIADWRFKATGRDEGFQMRVYRGNQTFYHDKQNKGGLDATMKDKYGPYNYGLGADDILVNVWNIEHDGSWTVTLYQRGENIGQMTNYTSSAGRTEKLHDLWAAYWIYQVYGAGFTTTSCQHLYKGTLKYPDEPYEIRAEKTDGSRAPYVCTAPPTTDYDEFKNIKYDFDLVSK